MAKILVIGPSGSGKTYFSTKLKEMGLNALDADSIDGLHGWFDENGNKVSFPPDANKEFLDTHDFLWNKEFLEQYLSANNNVFVFGLSGNVFEMTDLFDKVYYLYTSPEVIIDRLDHETRSNPMGKTEDQKKAVLNFKEVIDKNAHDKGLEFIDATISAEEMYRLLIERL